MTKGQALQEWFSQFLTAYSTSSVPDDAVFPWLTYELITGAWDSGEIGLTVNLWYYTEKEAEPNAKAQEISDAIGLAACSFRATAAQFGLSAERRGARTSRTIPTNTSSGGI